MKKDYSIHELQNNILKLQAQVNFSDHFQKKRLLFEPNSFIKQYSILLKNQLISACCTSSYICGMNDIDDKVSFVKLFQFYSIFKVNPQSVEQFSSNVFSYAQMFQQTIQNIIFRNEMATFTKCIMNYFVEVTPDLILFAHTTFPSLFCFFTLPETFNFALSVLKTMIVYDRPQVICHFISSFYESYPMFLTSLFEKYDELTFSLDRKLTPMMAFHNLILSIQYACTFLTKEHFRLAQNCYSDKELFSLTFIYTLLIPQMELRGYDPKIIEALLYVFNNKDTPSFHRLVKVFTTPQITRPITLSIYGGFPFMNFAIPENKKSGVPFYSSAYEILLLTEIICKYLNDESQLKQVYEGRKKLIQRNLINNIYNCQLYGTSLLDPSNKIKQMYEKGFLLDIPNEYKIDNNQEYDRFFMKILKQANLKLANPFEHFRKLFLSKDLFTFKNSLIFDEKFQIYSYKRIANEYITKLRRYDAYFAIHECIKAIEQLIKSSKQMLNEIMPYATLSYKEELKIEKENDYYDEYEEENEENFDNNNNNNKMNNAINFWAFLLDKNENVPQNEIVDDFSLLLVNNQNDCHFLNENELQKLHKYMEYVLHSNKRIAIVKIPKIIKMLENRFSYLGSMSRIDSAIYNTLVNITFDCKKEFASLFCLYFRNALVAGNGNRSMKAPHNIRKEWNHLYSLIGMFVLNNDKKFAQRLNGYFLRFNDSDE